MQFMRCDWLKIQYFLLAENGPSSGRFSFDFRKNLHIRATTHNQTRHQMFNKLHHFSWEFRGRLSAISVFCQSLSTKIDFSEQLAVG